MSIVMKIVLTTMKCFGKMKIAATMMETLLRMAIRSTACRLVLVEMPRSCFYASVNPIATGVLCVAMRTQTARRQYFSWGRASCCRIAGLGTADPRFGHERLSIEEKELR